MWTPYELKLYDEEKAAMDAQDEVKQGLKTIAECSWEIKETIAWRALSKRFGFNEAS